MSDILRRLVTLVCLSAVVSFGAVSIAHAQYGGGQDQGQGQGQDSQSDDEKAQEQGKKDAEWGDKDLHLKATHAEGPCPYVKVLYDAARYQEFKDDKESSAAAKWTGEINGISSDCAYKGTEPIQVGMDVSFSLGRGDQAESTTKVYHYWVAVTERDKTVLAKQDFDLPVTFAPGQKSMDVNTRIENISIPRADITVSGSNFEVLVGFDVTPQMVDFNRQGKHFRYVSPVEKQPGANTGSGN